MSCDFDYHQNNKTPIYDGHGIFLTYVCPRCKTEKLSGFRADIFEAYDCDEPIDD